ncbi:MAG: hydrogenase maturation protease [Chloroflexota bacterium]
MARTLVLGLGNPLLRDDSVGLRVVRALRPLVKDLPDVRVEEDYHGGLRLMERLIGFERAIIVDAICSGAPPGTIHRLGPTSVPTQHSASSHDVNLPTALALGRRSGAALPPDDSISLIAIEAAEVMSFGEDLTPDVSAAIPTAVELILAELTPKGGAA